MGKKNALPRSKKSAFTKDKMMNSPIPKSIYSKPINKCQTNVKKTHTNNAYVQYAGLRTYVGKRKNDLTRFLCVISLHCKEKIILTNEQLLGRFLQSLTGGTK